MPLRIQGGAEPRYEFSHKHLFEYFMAKKLVKLNATDSIIEDGSLLIGTRPIQAERGALRFWEEGFREEENKVLKQTLFEVMRVSRYADD